MTEKILFVDDEPAALEGYKRALYRDFQVDTAVGGADALAILQRGGPYAVVISDMRMPGMLGAELLSRIKETYPDTVRMLLTGYTDIDAATRAVNQGHIFRFLTKPCEKDLLVASIRAGFEQYRLVTGEKELLEKTLLGSIKVLADVLSAASPEAFGRSMRIANTVQHLLTKFSLASPWRFEAAATLSQLGCVTLETELMQRAYAGVKLSEDEQARFDAHPQAAQQLLAHIPRLEAVAWMIGQQLAREISETVPGVADCADVVSGAKLLKLAVAYEQLKINVSSKDDVLLRLRVRRNEFEPALVNALLDLKRNGGSDRTLQTVPVGRLRTGMVLGEEIKNTQGVLLVARGQVISSAVLMKLENLARAGLIQKEISVFI